MKGQFWTGLTALLGGICVLLLVLIAISAGLLGGAPAVTVENVDNQSQAQQLEGLKTVSFNDRNSELYTSAILQQPLFFADRSLPEIIDAEAAAALAAAEQGEQAMQEGSIEKLDARLAGIIITPDQRIAMVADNKSKKTLVLQEGMTLEGEQAAWRLDRIAERVVSFAAGDESTELELKVNTKGLQAPAVTRPQQAESNQNEQQSAEEIVSNARDAAAQREQTAAEIRRRIAERRAQLRAERARQAEDGNNND